MSDSRERIRVEPPTRTLGVDPNPPPAPGVTLTVTTASTGMRFTAPRIYEEMPEPLPAPPVRGRVVDVVFDGPPGPEGGRFVEVEDEHGRSVCVGEWREDATRPGWWRLCLTLADEDAP